MRLHGIPCLHNRSEPIRVTSVVVVDIATRIDIPTIVGIGAIATTKGDILRYNLRPIFSVTLNLST